MRGGRYRVPCEVLEFDPALVGRLSADAEQRLNREPDGGRMMIRALRYAWQNALTPVQRFYMQEYYLYRKTMPQIAANCGVSTGTVSRTLARARQRLRNALQCYIAG